MGEQTEISRFIFWLSCYAAKVNNPKIDRACGAGILPARLIQIKCTAAYNHNILIKKKFR